MLTPDPAAPEHPAPFPLLLPADEPVPVDRLDVYVAAFSPLLTDLAQLQRDLQRETRFGLSPLFLLDYSEIYHIWSSIRTMKGRQGRLDWRDMFMSQIISERRLPLYLPGGTLMEVASHLLSVCGNRWQFSGAQVARAADPRAGVQVLPEIDALIASLPSRKALMAGASLAANSMSAHGYREFAEKLRSKKLRHLHGEIWAHAVPWAHLAFKEALDFLNNRRAPGEAKNVWDALNLAIATSINRAHAKHRHVVYLIARGRSLRGAAESSPWLNDPMVRELNMDPKGVVRSPVYLFMRAKVAPPGMSPHDALVQVAELLGDLRRIHNLGVLLTSAAPRLVGSTVDARKSRLAAADTATTKTYELLRRATEQFQENHHNHLDTLYCAWEGYRRLEPTTFLPAIFPDAQTQQEPSTTFASSIDEVIGAAEESRLRLRRQLTGEGPEANVAFDALEEHSVFEGTEEHNYALRVQGDHEPFFHIEFSEGHYSACWHSNLDLHSFLDWIDQYASEVHWYANRYKVSMGIERRINNVVLVVPKDGERTPPEFVDSPQEDDDDDDDGPVTSIPFTQEDRTQILRSVGAGNIEAIRVYSAYGDAWLNFVYNRGGSRRTGFLSHLAAPAFLAQFVALTTSTNVSVKRLYAFLERVMSKHLSPLPTT